MPPATSNEGLKSVPLRGALSAKYKDTFAYPTIKDRSPVILCKVIDHLYRERINIGRELGTEAQEGLKQVVDELSKLRYEMQTNKPITPLLPLENDVDSEVWNSYLNKQNESIENLTWYSGAWLWVECYMYRRIHQAINSIKPLRGLDCFRAMKEEGMLSSLPSMRLVKKWLLNTFQDKDIKLKSTWNTLLEISLWGNKCDLSISAGNKMVADGDPVAALENLESQILVKEGDMAWETLQADPSGDKVVDIVMDNSGFELFTDLCLADFLISSGTASKVRMRIKHIPWFVSDTTPPDMKWTISKLQEDPKMQDLAIRWDKYLSSGKWIVVDDLFWTYPQDFSQLRTTDEALYTSLSEASLVIFKGDLNYRKLVGDLNWETTASFHTALQGFHPAPILSLRTAKADVIVGLYEGQAEKITSKDPDWMTNGQWGVIQFSKILI